MSNEIILSDIKPIQVIYSKLSKSLDKVFTGKSVKSFHYQITHPKKFTYYKIPIPKQHIYSTYITEVNEEINETPHNLTQENNKFNKIVNGLKRNAGSPKTSERVETDISEYHKRRHNNIVQSSLMNKLVVPPIGQYNLNYESIDKKLHGYASQFSALNSHDYDANHIRNTSATSRVKDISKILSASEKINEPNRRNLNLKTQEKEVLILPKVEKVPGSVRFDLQSARKQLRSRVQSPVVSYIDPNSKSIVRGITFDKMLKRERENIAHKKSNNPTIGYYNPRYETIQKKTNNFIPYDITKEKSNKYLMQKIWRSYNVNSSYKLVNLPAFNEKSAEKQNRWLEEKTDTSN